MRGGLPARPPARHLWRRRHGRCPGSLDGQLDQPAAAVGVTVGKYELSAGNTMFVFALR